MKILFVEPPKEFWFVMGEYLPPPLGILQLAAFLEEKGDDWDLEVLDCQAEELKWSGLERRLESANPDLLVPSALATCNAYTILRTVSLAKKIDPDIKTVVGGQHFTALAQESLEQYPEIDFIVRGEGELTLLELVSSLDREKSQLNIPGLSFRHKNKIVHNPPRPLIKNLDDLPLPGYHFIEDHAHKYHFRMMANRQDGYAMVEASRGCPYQCTFCSQWKFWGGHFRVKSPEKVADEMEYLSQEQGINCAGPIPADALFVKAVHGEYDAVVAMYHDQGMIPVKLMDFEHAVNITIGIPIVRTSPAHGTAFDIAGRNLANPSSMKSAVMAAIQMAKTRRSLALAGVAPNGRPANGAAREEPGNAA